MHGSLAVVHAAELFNIKGLSSVEFERTQLFVRRNLLGHGITTAIGIYALFGGSALLPLLPQGWRDDTRSAVALDAGAVALVAVRLVGFLLVAMYTPALIAGLGVGIQTTNVWFALMHVVPIVLGVYLVFGGGWIVRQAARTAAAE